MEIMKCKIDILCGFREAALSAVFSETAVPAGICAEIHQCGTELPELPEKQDILLLTDDPELLLQAVQREEPALRIVFLGNLDMLPNCLESLTDVWQKELPPVLLQKRLGNLLRQIENEYNSSFYQNALLTTIDSIPDMLWFKRLDGIHMLVNDAFCETVDKTKEDVQGKDHFYIWNVPKPEAGSAEFACAESEEIAIRTGKTYICDEIVRLEDSMKLLTTYKTPVTDRYGNLFGTVGIGRDVTGFSNLGLELSMLVENLPFPTIIFSQDWQIVRISSSFFGVAGVREEDAADFDYPAWKKRKLEPIGEPKFDKQKHMMLRTYRMNCGKMDRYFMIREQEILDYFGELSGYFCTLEDITIRYSYERSIIEAANTDMLTGLYNRRYFYHYLTENRSTALTLLYMDLDSFKEVNDLYGHARGDDVLVKTAQMIRRAFPDGVSARLGGDEFAVILIGQPEVTRRCAALERTLRETFRSEGLRVTVSIGAITADGALDDIDRFIHACDTQMYAVKRAHHMESEKSTGGSVL